MNSQKEAIILAGGLGTRLRSVVTEIPKVLAPVAGRPFLSWLLDGLARQEMSHVVLATGYMSAAVEAAIQRSHAGMMITYSPETEPLGTGGAIWAAMAHCRAEYVVVINGDSWIGTPLASLRARAAAGADIVMTVRPVADRARYGSVRVAAERLLGLDEKGPTGPGLVNGGLYVMRRDLVQRRPMPGSFSFERDVLAEPGDLDIVAYRSDAEFIDIGTPDDFHAAQSLLPRWAAAW
ncbi:sugar phosphate nucleotidyltransferase [Lichenihabitans psoromatis]|uniref:sugar phosphate nucleotidyltransferase n=1 Tax=Lichenihabitans psoromatis TaxID=2528642 RepID=UPI0013F143DE|nr:sugar phosphate nucleotidyltransferase [Lichenihabitans psoromatis]